MAGHTEEVRALCSSVGLDPDRVVWLQIRADFTDGITVKAGLVAEEGEAETMAKTLGTVHLVAVSGEAPPVLPPTVVRAEPNG